MLRWDNWMDHTELGLEDEEVQGMAPFNDEEKGTCSLCRLVEPRPDGCPLFTGFTYDNLGVPKNPVHPFYHMPRKWNPDGEDWVDHGLGAFLKSAGCEPDAYRPEMGKQRVPTLRNVDRRPDPGVCKAYAHNGFFESLDEIVHFYNTRDVEEWPDSEAPGNVNDEELGDLGLSAEEEALIVLFKTTLSDGYEAP